MKQLTFLPRFAGKVISGGRFHTIRERDAPIEVGDVLEFVDDERGPIGRGRCIGKSTILLALERAIFAEGRPSARLFPIIGECRALEAFAKADGFTSYRDLTDWIKQRYGRLPFAGVVLVCEVNERQSP